MDMERSPCCCQEIPADTDRQKVLLRSLLNIRPPKPVRPEFLTVQDVYLQEELAEKKITRLSDLSPVQDGTYLWRGDITTLACGAIVNAANSGMTGCYQPCHNCIDNCIHTYAGVQLRLKCTELMERHCEQLESCYHSCLELADENGVKSIAFCCISTGVFLFPNDRAAEIAVRTVRKYKAETGSQIEVIFNVFKEQDERIYRKLLCAD